MRTSLQIYTHLCISEIPNISLKTVMMGFVMKEGSYTLPPCAFFYSNGLLENALHSVHLLDFILSISFVTQAPA